MQNSQFLQLQKGDSPIVAAAIHDGHELRDEVNNIMLLTESASSRSRVKSRS